MKDDCSRELPLLHLYIRGALSLFEHEGSQVFRILNQQENRYPSKVFEHIGTALLFANDTLEEILEVPHEEEKV